MRTPSTSTFPSRLVKKLICFVALNRLATTYQLAKRKGQRAKSKRRTLCAMPLALSELSRLASGIFLSSLQPSFSATCQEGEPLPVSFFGFVGFFFLFFP